MVPNALGGPKRRIYLLAEPNETMAHEVRMEAWFTQR